MENFERILGKVVGQEMTEEELLVVSGGAPVCKKGEAHTIYHNGGEACDVQDAG